MASVRLTTIRVEKPWGRHRLWPGFADPAPDAQPVGEIWFEAPDAREPELLVKYLFTSERLSIQVHPNDAQARARGFARGKDEAWVILDAQPGSTIALGTTRPLSQQELQQAALDGSIEMLMDWKPVSAGDVIYSPANTVHAIGAGITLIEVQQNVDLTYRLYDYGRPRELHLEDGIAVSDPVPFVIPKLPGASPAGRQTLAHTDKFTLERWTWSGSRTLTLKSAGWLVPIRGAGQTDGLSFHQGECWAIDGGARLSIEPGSDLLFASPQPFELD
ncbi:MAG: class I mannose-6-phosphate isomerase [Sphingomonadaceae bacterium]